MNFNVALEIALWAEQYTAAREMTVNRTHGQKHTLHILRAGSG
jgi:hypothetical protein